MKMATNTKSCSLNATSLFRMTISAALIGATVLVSACTTEQVLSNGPSLDETQLALVPVGSSRDQVLLSLGTPSTTGTFDNEVFYYISQTRTRRYQYQKLKLVDQRVVAIYFDETDTVSQVADYRLQDGKVFDFISRTTPTGGKDVTLLARLFGGPAKKDGKPVVPQLGGLSGN